MMYGKLPLQMEASIRTSIGEVPQMDLSPKRKADFTRQRKSVIDSSRTMYPGQLRETLARKSYAPIISGCGDTDQSMNMTELKQLTFNTKTSRNDGLTRKHHIAMDGQVGHGRSLSNSINFKIFNYEGKGNYPSIGFGTDMQMLK